jgi:hypothetical protein
MASWSGSQACASTQELREFGSGDCPWGLLVPFPAIDDVEAAGVV